MVCGVFGRRRLMANLKAIGFLFKIEADDAGAKGLGVVARERNPVQRTAVARVFLKRRAVT